MHKLFTGLTILALTAVVGQFYLAGRGTFTGSFDTHRGLGFATLLLAVLLTLVGVLGRLPRRVVARSGAAVGLLLLQPVIAVVAHGIEDVSAAGFVFGFHAANGALILAVLGATLHASRAVAKRAPVAVPAAKTEPRPSR